MSGKPRRPLTAFLSPAKISVVRRHVAKAGLRAARLDAFMEDLHLRVSIAASMGVRFAPLTLDAPHLVRFRRELGRFRAEGDLFRHRLARQTIWRDEEERQRHIRRFGPDYRADLGALIRGLLDITQRLSDFERSLETLDRQLARRSGGARGAPPRQDVWVMLCSLADLLMDYSLPVTKTRSGLFVQLASLLHPDARDVDAPQVIAYPLIRRAVDLVREGRTLLELGSDKVN